MIHLRILIIEDSISDTKLLIRQLRKYGYEIDFERVETATAMQSALDSQTWDLIISDYSMPYFNGIEALKLLKLTKYDTPFIMISGVMGEDIGVEVMRAGANDYVLKDNIGRLMLSIDRELREAQERQAHRNAEAQIDLLSQALAQSTNLVMMTDSELKVIYANPAFFHVSGYSPEGTIGQFIYGFLNIDRVVYDRIQQGNPFQAQVQQQRKDGTPYWVQISITPVLNPHNDLTQYLILQEDITEYKLLVENQTQSLTQIVEDRTSELELKNKALQDEILERQQIQSQLSIARDKALEVLRLKSAILTNINHDIQTPLNIISLYAQMIQSGKPSKQKQYAEILDKEVKNLSDYVKKLLSLADIEAQQVELNFSLISPKILINDTLSAMRPFAEKKNLKLIGFVSNDFPSELYTDFERIHLILRQLISNAIQFTEVGEIHVAMECHSHQSWTLSVRDTGSGILPEEQEHIFDLFWQGDMSLNRNLSRGSGLGLAIVKQYTDLMGGRVSVDSDGYNGTTFTVTFSFNEQQVS